MSEEELKEFLIQQELKIKQKTKEENEANESNLSTILGDLENSLSTCLKSDKKDESFLKKLLNEISFKDFMKLKYQYLGFTLLFIFGNSFFCFGDLFNIFNLGELELFFSISFNVRKLSPPPP